MSPLPPVHHHHSVYLDQLDFFSLAKKKLPHQELYGNWPPQQFPAGPPKIISSNPYTECIKNSHTKDWPSSVNQGWPGPRYCVK